jgi:hypothetical protein
MNIQRVKQGAKITFYNGIYMILLGFFIIFFIDFNMSINFSFVPQLWGFFLKYSSGIAFMIILFNVLIGILMISQGIIILYLSDFIIKRKEKMTWVILFVSGIISWAGILTIFILLRNLLLISLAFIGWLTFVIGMLIPIRYYLEKPYKEY